MDNIKEPKKQIKQLVLLSEQHRSIADCLPNYNHFTAAQSW